MKKGDRVTCINNNVEHHVLMEYTYWPLKGQEYVIREVVQMKNGFWGVKLEGLINRDWYDSEYDTWFEPVYAIEGFEKVSAPKSTTEEINAELLVNSLLIEIGFEKEK